jgi:hypothetical protein
MSAWSRRFRGAPLGLPALVLASCMSGSSPDKWGGAQEESSVAPAEPEYARRGYAADEPAPPPMSSPAPAPMAPGSELDALIGGIADNEADGRGGRGDADEDRSQSAQDGDDAGGADVRRWFPEAFLWQPMVATDASGEATVEVRVPDTLTTWRILALAHDRRGQQAGDVHTFASRLPVYVEPVVPGWLYAGDRFDLPVQVASASPGEVRGRLLVDASGALSGQGAADVALSPGGSAVRRIGLSATGAGEARVLARFGDADAAERVIPVIPRGRPVEARHGGAVADTRTFTVAGPDGADPTTEELVVVVFPGPLAVLASEAERARLSGPDPASAAYGFALASRMEDVAAATQADLDEDALRRLRIVAWQRVARHGRTSDLSTAVDLLGGLGDPGTHELAAAMKLHLVGVVVGNQRGDGTFAFQDRAPLPQILVQTSLATRALPTSETAARLKAQGALERFARDVTDPYTAAAILASGVVTGAQRDRLLTLVTDALVDADGGGKDVVVPDGARNARGVRPSASEVRAMTALALTEADHAAIRGDLVARLMASYDADRGFGAGAADVLALDAVLAALPTVASPVTVSFAVDGAAAISATLDPTSPMRPAFLSARPSGGAGTATLTVSPATPGLAFVATRRSYVPWTGAERLAGVDVEVEMPRWSVGSDATMVLSLAAPSGTSVTLEQPLPAGAIVDEAALAGIGGVVASDVTTDRVRVTTRPFSAGEVLQIPITLRPAFAGSFSTGPVWVEAGGERVALAPAGFVVAPSPMAGG